MQGRTTGGAGRTDTRAPDDREAALRGLMLERFGRYGALWQEGLRRPNRPNPQRTIKRVTDAPSTIAARRRALIEGDT